ncbi:hypothetical protein XAB3213_2060032 [Xanthomonas citri pv. bilvae]|nr:hypothetical protein XAB3213_2060032 [Xanthomonas citri pv. bilvae]
MVCGGINDAQAEASCRTINKVPAAKAARCLTARGTASIEALWRHPCRAGGPALGEDVAPESWLVDK